MTFPRFITNIENDARRRLFKHYWAHPWEVPTSPLKAVRFKRRIWKNGFVSPHYRRSEAACKDGTPVPWYLRNNCQKQGFHLERARHAQGDRPLKMLSWYRTPSYNAHIGGASGSQHIYARACDPLDRISVSVAQKVWANGGIGYQSYIGGTIRHVDVGPRRQWVY